MERREFCRFLGVCGLVACTGGLTGCARALQWSEAQHAQIVTRQFGSAPPPAETTASAGATGSTNATGGAGAPQPSTYPDIAVTTGNDPPPTRDSLSSFSAG